MNLTELLSIFNNAQTLSELHEQLSAHGLDIDKDPAKNDVGTYLNAAHKVADPYVDRYIRSIQRGDLATRARARMCIDIIYSLFRNLAIAVDPHAAFHLRDDATRRYNDLTKYDEWEIL